MSAATTELGLLMKITDDQMLERLRILEEKYSSLTRASQRSGDRAAQHARRAADATRLWERGVRNLERAWSRAFRTMRWGFDAAITWLRRLSVAGTAAIGALITAGMRFNATMELGQVRMSNFLDPVYGRGTASRQMEKIKVFAAKTPFELGPLTNAAAFSTALRLWSHGGPAQWAYRAAALAAGKGEFSQEAILQGARAAGYLNIGRPGEAMEALARMGVSV
ncbi:MAG: hypothetical protein GF320_21340, partial [Armatimonadia bacterium]|nr:hypothetical protein [Armatimonadia bacterium]